MLSEVYDLTKENNKMLRAIRRDARFAFYRKIIFWIILVAVPTYLFVTYALPFLNSTIDTLNQVNGTLNQGTGQLESFMQQIQQLGQMGR